MTRKKGKKQIKSESSSSLSGISSSPDIEVGSRHRHTEMLAMPDDEVLHGAKSPKIVEQLKLVVKMFENVDLSTNNKSEQKQVIIARVKSAIDAIATILPNFDDAGKKQLIDQIDTALFEILKNHGNKLEIKSANNKKDLKSAAFTGIIVASVILGISIGSNLYSSFAADLRVAVAEELDKLNSTDITQQSLKAAKDTAISAWITFSQAITGALIGTAGAGLSYWFNKDSDKISFEQDIITAWTAFKDKLESLVKEQQQLVDQIEQLRAEKEELENDKFTMQAELEALKQEINILKGINQSSSSNSYTRS